MNDNKDAIQLLLDTGAELEAPVVVEIGGRYYTKQNLREVGREPKADPIKASTLSALLTYLQSCRGELKDKAIIHVVNPERVRLICSLDTHREREVLFECEAILPERRFDRWISQEEFMIYLASCFEESDDKALLLQFAGTVEAKTVATYGDDGISQKAVVSNGVASKSEVVLPSRVALAPYVTFTEVDQPVSEFIFRLNDQPNMKLIRADGGAWRQEAMFAVSKYLQEGLDNLAITDIPILV